ncbi:Uncharacterised protein [uncultured archaeon]|nr:Uncharacterised protein [uncultured archaeon]
MAEQRGLSPEEIRSHLRELGYRLIKNNHNRMVWIKDRGKPMSYTRKIAPLEEYLSKCLARQTQFFDKSEIGRIANRTGVNRESVRATLRRKGYRLTTNGHGIPVWIKKE